MNIELTGRELTIILWLIRDCKIENESNDTKKTAKQLRGKICQALDDNLHGEKRLDNNS
jgi:hypothetical protein